MTLLASAIIDTARITLLDPAPGVAWSNAELLSMLNEVQRSACGLRPDLYTLRQPMPMVAGTLQAIPAGGTAFIRLDENVTGSVTGGVLTVTTHGLRCRLVDSALLNAALRTWPAIAGEVDVLEYATDAKDKKRFHVIPPNDGSGWVVAHWCGTPPLVTATTDALALDDNYALLLKHGLLSEAYASNTKRQDLTKASFYRQSFEKMLGMGAQATTAMQPKYGTTPGAA